MLRTQLVSISPLIDISGGSTVLLAKGRTVEVMGQIMAFPLIRQKYVGYDQRGPTTALFASHDGIEVRPDEIAGFGFVVHLSTISRPTSVCQ